MTARPPRYYVTQQQVEDARREAMVRRQVRSATTDDGARGAGTDTEGE
jgi:hypothetical protein